MQKYLWRDKQRISRYFLKWPTIANRLKRTKTNQSPLTYFCFSAGSSGKFGWNPRRGRTYGDCEYKLGWRWFDQTRKTCLLSYQGVDLWPSDLKVEGRWVWVEPLTWCFLIFQCYSTELQDASGSETANLSSCKVLTAKGLILLKRPK